MPRPLTALVVLGLLPAVASTAPIPRQPPKDPPLYYPTRVGAKWVYRVFGQERTSVVTRVEDKDGAKVVTTNQLLHGVALGVDNTVEVSAGGLVVVTDEFGRPTTPERLLCSKPGDTWESTAGPVPLKLANTAVRVERVEVPAGVFQALRVESRYTIRGKEGLSTCWYAPGVGLVKSVCGDEDPGNVLVSFTPPED